MTHVEVWVKGQGHRGVNVKFFNTQYLDKLLTLILHFSQDECSQCLLEVPCWFERSLG